MNTLKHWYPHLDENNIAWLKLKYANGHTNVLNHEVLTELEQLIKQYEEKLPKGIVILSANENGFVAGADIHEFTQFNDTQKAYEYLRYGQHVFARLEQLQCPTVALINGFCLGGGLEMSLACRYRILLDDDKTHLGFPEVTLGIHPGWGGCKRSAKLLGGPAALNLILSGHTINALTAKKIGLAHDAVPLRQFERAAVYFINHQNKNQKISWWKKISNEAWIRPLIAYFIRKKLKVKVIEAHYPAPYAALALWEKTGPNAKNADEKEAESVSKLILHATTQNLLRVYYLRERLKKLHSEETLDESNIKQVHVVGAGTMGGDIAAWCALYHYRVSVQDQQLKMLASTEKRAAILASKKLNKKYAQRNMLDRLILDTSSEGVKHADIIIEAIPEKLSLKQTLWENIEKQAKPNALFVTNTSSIPLSDITKNFIHPERLAGMHFFNPVAAMPLIEVVAAANTDPKLIKATHQFVKKIGKLPLHVKSSPGFLVNRVLTPYLLEAAELYAEGIPAEKIDKALINFGMPMGPIILSDTIGLDVCLAVADHLASHYGWDIPQILRDKVEKGNLGKKTGKGFYSYKNGKAQHLSHHNVSSNTALNQDEITQRLVMSLLNQAMACLREKIVEDADLVDAGMIFGAGFAPFLGGPLHYAKTVGTAHVLRQLQLLEQRYGKRFTPDQGWQLNILA